MPVKPSSLPVWATNVGTTVTPSAGQQQAGFAVNTKPPARWMNWILNLLYTWIQYVDNPTSTSSAAAFKGTNSSTGPGLQGINSGSGIAVYGQNTGTGYGVVAEAGLTTPVRASLRVVPQDTAPSSPEKGAVYFESNNIANSSGRQAKGRFYNGYEWERICAVSYRIPNVTADTLAGVTSETAFANTYAIKANTLVAGSIIRVRAHVKKTSNTNTAVTVCLRWGTSTSTPSTKDLYFQSQPGAFGTAADWVFDVCIDYRGVGTNEAKIHAIGVVTIGGSTTPVLYSATQTSSEVSSDTVLFLTAAAGSACDFELVSFIAEVI